jgi:hypothetical protein
VHGHVTSRINGTSRPAANEDAPCSLQTLLGNFVILGSSRSTRPRADRNGYLRNNLKGGATRLMGVIALLSIGDERPLIVLYTRPVPRTGRSPHSAGHLSRGEMTCDAGTYVPMHITRMTCYNHPCRGRTHLLHTAEVLPPLFHSSDGAQCCFTLPSSGRRLTTVPPDR